MTVNCDTNCIIPTVRYENGRTRERPSESQGRPQAGEEGAAAAVPGVLVQDRRGGDAGVRVRGQGFRGAAEAEQRLRYFIVKAALFYSKGE